MSLLVKTINKELETLQKNDISLKAIGDIASLPEKTQAQLQKAIDATADNKRMSLVLALSYGSRWEITEACRQIAKKVKKGEIDPEQIDQDLISRNLNTDGIPDPELLIRTSGELRISNFLLWQIAYTELYFTEKLWPEFRKEDLYEAIIDFQNRERRFGKTSEQIQKQ